MAFYQPAPTCQIPELWRHYEELFGKKADGIFVEVGAYDGEICSNTSCLADLGWKGVYIEPVPAFARVCAARHRNNPGVQVLNCAIGEEPGVVDVFVGGVLSTTSQRQVELYGRIDWAKGFHRGEQTQARQVRLDAVLDEQKILPGFDLLVVDVEGSETEVFNSFDLERFRPEVLLVELEDAHQSFQKFPEATRASALLRARILAGGYRQHYRDEINTIFVRDRA